MKIIFFDPVCITTMMLSLRRTLVRYVILLYKTKSSLLFKNSNVIKLIKLYHPFGVNANICNIYNHIIPLGFAQTVSIKRFCYSHIIYQGLKPERLA